MYISMCWKSSVSVPRSAPFRDYTLNSEKYFCSTLYTKENNKNQLQTQVPIRGKVFSVLRSSDCFLDHLVSVTPRPSMFFSKLAKKTSKFLVFCFWHREENQKTSLFLYFLYWREIKHEKQKLTKNRPKKSNLWLFDWFISIDKNKRFLLIFVFPPEKKSKGHRFYLDFWFFLQHINQKTKIFSWFLFFLQHKNQKTKTSS